MNQCALNMSHCQQKLTDNCVDQDNGVADGPKPSDPDTQAEPESDNMTANTKLWLGKDYSNFIRKDWVQLDKPFEGILSKSPSVSHTLMRINREAVYAELSGSLFIFFQITSTVLKFLACLGVICLQLFMALLPEM